MVKIRNIIIVIASLLISLGSTVQSAFANNEKNTSVIKFNNTNCPFTYWSGNIRNPKVVVLLLHGFGLHKEAFDNFAQTLSDAQIAAYAIDIHGLGSWQTENPKSQKLQFDKTLADTGSILICLRKIHPGVPLILVGESMGGAFAIQATAMYPQFVDGLVASVPSCDFFNKKKTALQACANALKLDQYIDLQKILVENATSNKALQNAWEQDPEARLKMSFKEMLDFQLFIRKTTQLASSITDKPVLMLHGAQDRLAKPSGTFKLFNSLATKDKDLIMLGSAEHLIFEAGQCNKNTITILLGWLNDHFKCNTISLSNPASGS